MVSLTTIPGGNYTICLLPEDEKKLSNMWTVFNGDPKYDKKGFIFKVENDPFPVKLRVCDIRSIEFIST